MVSKVRLAATRWSLLTTVWVLQAISGGTLEATVGLLVRRSRFLRVADPLGSSDDGAVGVPVMFGVATLDAAVELRVFLPEAAAAGLNPAVTAPNHPC